MIRPWSVYRLFAADGSLLYVGSTNDLERRLAEHRRKQSWGDQIATWTEDWPHMREAAYRIEGAAIDAEQPIHNQRRAPQGDPDWIGMSAAVARLKMPTLESLNAKWSATA